MLKKISQILDSEKNILLVGKSNSGKTFFVKNKLIPFLEKRGKFVKYFANLEGEISVPKKSVVIFDEFEILEDRDFLEKNHLDKKPYYSEEYLVKIKKWQKKIADLENPAVYILTRNRQEEIMNVSAQKSFGFCKKEVAVVEFGK